MTTQSTGAAVAPKSNLVMLLALIEEQAQAFEDRDHRRATEIETQLRRDFAGVMCLNCDHEVYIHTPSKCTGPHGDVPCACLGLKSDLTQIEIGDPLAGADIISRCSRADLIEAGDLVDVTRRAKEAGIRLPVALTKAVYSDCVVWTEADKKRKRAAAQDQEGRLWDVINGLAWALRNARKSKSVASQLTYQIHRVPRDGDGMQPMRVTLKAVVHPGDNGESVLTLSEPDED